MFSRIQELDSQGTITKRPTLGIITNCRSILRKHVFLGGIQKLRWQNFEPIFQKCQNTMMPYSRLYQDVTLHSLLTSSAFYLTLFSEKGKKFQKF